MHTAEDPPAAKFKTSIHGWIKADNVDNANLPRSPSVQPGAKPSLKHVDFASEVHIPVPKSSSKRAVKLVDGITAGKKRGRVLHLFSGPSNRTDGIGALLRIRGWECDDYDCKENNCPDQDITRDDVWLPLLQKIKQGYYDAIVTGPPCETFSHARAVQPGPRPLRSFSKPYGLPKADLYPEEWEQLRIGNLLALRNAEACKAIHDIGGAFLIENPREWDESPSIWLLDEYKELAKLPGVKDLVIDQCGFGAASQKPTRLRYARMQLDVAAYTCRHPKQKFWDRYDKPYWSSHERLVGRKDASGRWATKAAAAWPGKLNDIFVSVIVHAGPLVTGRASSGSLNKDWQ